jgi:hypothetical protein
MAVWTSKFVVHDEDWLHEQWTRMAPLRRSFGCVQARLLRHATESATYFAFYEFRTIEDAKGYLQAAQLQIRGEGLAQFTDQTFYDFYASDAFVNGDAPRGRPGS